MKKSAFKYISKVFVSLICILYIFLPINNIVYAQDNSGEVLGDATTFTDSQKTLLLAKPAVVQVSNIITGQIVIQATLANSLGAPGIAGMYYEFTLGFGGSGFFITDNGYLITNGHVAQPDNDIIAYYAIAQLAESIYRDAIIIMWENTYGYTPTESEVDAAFDIILNQTYGGSFEAMVNDLYSTDYRGGNLKMESVKNNNFIQTGAVSGTEKVVKELGKAANVIDTLYDGDFDSSDIALLKVEGANFPTVELGSSQNVQIGSELYVIGYPGVVDQTTGYFTDVESSLEPTITKGIISAKKTLVDGTEAFQTDAAISGGNSGGPALDSNGKVIGMATWTISEYEGVESYNFLISIESIQKLLSKNNITPNEGLTSKKWEEALNEYSSKCYTNAKKKFEETKNLYPDNVDVEDFLTKCQTAIDKGEDKCLSKIEPWMYILGAVCCGLGFLVFIIIVFVFIIKGKKKKDSNVSSEVKKEAKEESKK
jgi:serine protease Do